MHRCVEDFISRGKGDQTGPEFARHSKIARIKQAFKNEVESYTEKSFLEILLNQPKIRLYLPFSDRFGFKRTSVCIQINWIQTDVRLHPNQLENGKYNLISG